MLNRFSQHLLRFLFSGILSSSAVISHAGMLDTGFVAVYEVQHKQIYLGDATRTLKQNKEGQWQYHTETETKGLASLLIKDVINETTTFKRQTGNIIPLVYEYRQHGGKREKHFLLEFNWDKLELVNSYKKETFPIKPGTQDLLSFQLQLMQDLQSGKRSISYTIADRKRIEAYKLTNKGKTEIETPMKTFQAIQLVSDVIRNKAQFKIWCVPELQYLPVRVLKIDDDGDESEFSLRSIRFLKR